MKVNSQRVFGLCLAAVTVATSCRPKDPNEAAALELERNRKKLAEIQTVLKRASEESAALTKKIDSLSAEVAAMQGSAAPHAP